MSEKLGASSSDEEWHKSEESMGDSSRSDDSSDYEALESVQNPSGSSTSEDELLEEVTLKNVVGTRLRPRS